MYVFKQLSFWFISFIVILTNIFMPACSQRDHTLYQSDDFYISWLIEPGIYDDIQILSKDYLALCENKIDGLYAIADNAGKRLSEPINAHFLSEQEQRILAMTPNNSRFVFYTPDGVLLNDCEYNAAFPFCEGYAAVSINGKWGFIDRSGHEILPMKYDSVANGFSSGLAAVKQNGEWIYIRKDGTAAFDCAFEDATMFSEGMAAVKENGKWGYINTSGETVVEFIYEDAHCFSEGTAAVCLSIDSQETWQYISKDGTLLFTVPYVDVSDGRTECIGEFKNGYAMISSSLYCLIDRSGNTVLGDNSAFLTLFSEYDNAFGVVPAYIPVEVAGKPGKKYGYIDINGNEILPFRFDYTSALKGNLAMVMEYKADSQNRQENKRSIGVLAFTNK